MDFYYIYVLLSEKDNKLYYGYSKNLKLRIEQHNNGEVKSTKYRRPLKLIYYEACLKKEDALKREKYFKTFYGNMYIKKRLKTYFELLNSYSTGQV
jgi:putative endonuclease